MEPGDEVLNFDLDDDDYKTFIDRLRHTLAHHPQRQNFIEQYGKWLEDHPLLPEQRHPIRPARWIYINLTVQDQNTRGVLTLAVRDDNVYLMGFKNRHGHWHEFGFEGKSTRFLQNSTFLGCDVSYGDLARSGELVNLDLGKEAMTCAVLRLGAYQHVGPANAGTRKDLARLCFMICEAARMVPHCQKVGGDGGWINGGSRLEQLQYVDYARTWSKMSRALITSCALSDPPRLGTLVEFDVVHLLLNSLLPQASDGRQQQPSSTAGADGSSQQDASSSSSTGGGGAQEQTTGKSVRGRPLVEVVGIIYMYDRGDVVGTIAVFDGKRGQIIYKHQQETLRPNYPYGAILPLTGPYRAISAEGSFAIQFYGITSGTDASGEYSKIIGEMLWDCYANNVVYDKVLTRVISTDTGYRLAEVAYAVWSDAVEATVEVNLLLTGITSVYGTITAFCGEFDGQEVLLFSRGTDEKVELVPSGGADSKVPLELGRSVIAVPVLRRYSRVSVLVELDFAHPNKEGEVRLLGSSYFYLDKHTGEIRIDQDGEFFVPVGWAGISDPTGGGHGAESSASHQGTEQTTMQQVKVQVNITSPGFHVSPLEPESLWHMGIAF